MFAMAKTIIILFFELLKLFVTITLNAIIILLLIGIVLSLIILSYVPMPRKWRSFILYPINSFELLMKMSPTAIDALRCIVRSFRGRREIMKNL